MSSRPTRASSTPSSGCGAARNPSPSTSATWTDAVAAWTRWTLDATLSACLAPTCVACGEWLTEATRGPVCASCWRAVKYFTPPLCLACGAPVPRSTRALERRPGDRLQAIGLESYCAGPDSADSVDVTGERPATPGDAVTCALCARDPLRGVARAGALGPHEGALRHIVHGFKFGRCPTLAAALAELMRKHLASVVDDVDCAVAVPLHRSRHRERGFNQAHELARHLGPDVVPALRRLRPTAAQATLHAPVRHANVAGAFALSWRVRLAPGHRRRLAGARVVLVDDVWTTGATLSACAQVLLEAGVREVRAVTVARAMPKGAGHASRGPARQA